jgi:hypothetical protein
VDHGDKAGVQDQEMMEGKRMKGRQKRLSEQGKQEVGGP